MKIVKILFLGIVLVILNLALLAAQTLPDTVKVTPAGAEPGGVLKVAVDVYFHSSNAGGLVLAVTDLPDGLATTSTGVNITDGANPAPTDPGTWYFEYTEGYGQVIRNGAGLTVDGADVLVDPEANSLAIAVLGANLLGSGGLLILPQEFGGVDPAAPRTLVNVYFNVPEDFEEDTYELTVSEDGAQIGSYSPPGILDGTPTVELSPIVIADIPDSNTVSLDASATAMVGGEIEIPVYVANKDTIGSGSFDILCSGCQVDMTLESLAAGARAGGMTFSSSFGDSVLSVSFLGGTIPTGAMGVLATVTMSVAADAPVGASNMLMLQSVSLKDSNGSDLVVASSPQGTLDLGFAYGDTLFVDVVEGTRTPGQAWEGTGIAMIIEGQLHLPIRLKNSKPVTAIDFWIMEGPVDQVETLSLANANSADNNSAAYTMPIMTLDATDNWTITAADSGSAVHVVGYAQSTADAIPAGDEQIFHVVYDINVGADDVPTEGIDVIFGLASVDVVDNNGQFVGIETMGGTATIDDRVPTGNEGVNPGADLPRAFALAQNHPNPFNPSTTINYQIPEGSGNVNFTLNVYDIRGRLVRNLAGGVKAPGSYTAYWDGTNDSGQKVSSGVYFYRFLSSEYTATRKMVLLK